MVVAKMEEPEVEIDIEPQTEKPTMDIQEPTDEEPTMETDMDSGPNEPEEIEQPDSEATEESTVEDESSDEQEEVQPKEVEESTEEPVEETEEQKEEPKKEIKQAPKKQEEQKQKAATKIVKKMGDKGRYEANNQLKTLIVMQVLANSKDFFVETTIPDVEGFFTNETLKDSVIEDNNLAQYYLMMSNDAKHLELENLQYGRN